MGKKKTTFNIDKKENFSEWYTEILKKAEITDIRYNVKGFEVIRPWGARMLEKMFRLYESALRATGHDPSFFPIVIPEGNFQKEAGHVEGFSPEVFWIENAKGGESGEEKLALRPTSEAGMYEMYEKWIRSYRDLPLKIYQRANIFRYETKATRPLLRGREFYWIEAHDVFATKKEAEEQVKQDIAMTEEVMHKLFGVPFLAMRRPEWDTFPGAEYTVGSDSILPDGKVVQQPSTHLLGQRFSKAFNIQFVDEKEKEQYAWQTCYGPGMSRMMASIISVHGDDGGLILPYTIAPTQVIITTIQSSEELHEEAHKIKNAFFEENIDAGVDNSDKRPGEKFFYWEMKGVPFRIELGEKEMEKGEVTVFIRDTKEKKEIKLENLIEEIKNLGAEYDARIRKKADEEFASMIVDCKDKEEVKKALENKKIARFNFYSLEKEGEEYAEYIEKELNARVMGSRADKKEKANGKCIFSGKKATVIAYAGRSY